MQKTFSIFDMFSNAFPFLLKETFFFKLINIERIKKEKGRVKSKACKYPTTTSYIVITNLKSFLPCTPIFGVQLVISNMTVGTFAFIQSSQWRYSMKSTVTSTMPSYSPIDKYILIIVCFWISIWFSKLLSFSFENK